MARANNANAGRERPVHGRPAPRCTDEERDFVREHYGRMSQAAMARELHRSTGLVSKLVREMGLAEGARRQGGAARPVRAGPEPEGGTALTRLRKLRAIVWRNLLDCDPRQLAALSKEYRALDQDIADLERAEGGGDDGAGDALDAIVGAIGRKLSS